MTVSTLQREIYNTYLATTARYQKRPYKKRVNFNSIKPEVLSSLILIEKFVVSRNVIIPLFFESSYLELSRGNDDLVFIKLDHFTSYKAKTAYARLLKKCEGNLDMSITLSRLKRDIRFLVSHCKDNKISISEYLNTKSNSNYIWFSHISTNSVSKELIIGLMGSFSKFLEYEEDCAFLLGSDYRKILSNAYNNYIQSVKFKSAINFIQKSVAFNKK